MDEKVKQITPMQMSAILAQNNQDELSAIKGYFDLLAKISDSGIVGERQYRDVVATINEIIADEMNHSEKLSTLITKYSQIQPAKS